MLWKLQQILSKVRLSVKGSEQCALSIYINIYEKHGVDHFVMFPVFHPLVWIWLRENWLGLQTDFKLYPSMISSFENLKLWILPSFKFMIFNVKCCWPKLSSSVWQKT